MPFCCGLPNEIIAKVMYCRSEKEVWDKLVGMYQSDVYIARNVPAN